MTKPKCGYQTQEAPLTLREGIAEYYAANPQLLLPASSDAEAAAFFRCHDRVHVVFGCDTSFLHELRTDCWTFFGSDIGIRYARFLKSPAVQALYKDLQQKAANDPAMKAQLRADVKRSLGRALITPLQTFARARRMKKKWPWLGSDALLDKPLNEIRQEFGIAVLA